MVKLALISVSDKTGLDGLGPGLQELGYTLISTGGTAGVLASAGCEVLEVSQHRIPGDRPGRYRATDGAVVGQDLYVVAQADVAWLGLGGGDN